MKAPITFLCRLVLPLAVVGPTPVRAVWIDQEISKDLIKVRTSSQYAAEQKPERLIDGSGMQDDRHDNDGSARTMWHTMEKPAPTSPAAGLPPSPAWVLFDFAQPQRFDSIHVWNHNQANLTDRGFRKARIFGSADGSTWVTLTTPEIIELPRASGSPELEAVVLANPAKVRELKSVVIEAESKDGNYGSDYFGLSAVRFTRGREVAERDLPVPTSMRRGRAPVLPLPARRPAGPTIAISLRGGSFMAR